ncbi:hypothetical protein D3C75_466710 [compost metagenome]
MRQREFVIQELSLKLRTALEFLQHAQLEHLVEQRVVAARHLLAEVTGSYAFDDAELVIFEASLHVEPQTFQCAEVAEVRVIDVTF